MGERWGLRRAGGSGTERIQPFARYGRHGEYGRIFKEGAGQEVGHVFTGQLQHLSIHHVHLGERHKAMTHAKKRTYFKVFPSLRHHAFVGRDDEENEIDARSAGHHGTHETLVAGHIYDAHAFAAGQIGIGEAQFYGDAAALLFAEAVAVDAGERSHQRSLAVVDVTGGTQDDRHGNS